MDQTIFDPIDAYCERLGPGLWAEPLNAVTNLAFLVAALFCARRLGASPGAAGHGAGGRPRGDRGGLGPLSYLRKTGSRRCSTCWPIAAFIFVYVFAVNRHVLGWPRGWAWASMLALAPYLAVATTGFAALPGFDISAAYWSVAALIALYGVTLWQRRPGFRARPADRRGHPEPVDHGALRRSEPLRGMAPRHAFPVACPECRHAGLDDRNLSPRRAPRAACSGTATGLNRARITTPLAPTEDVAHVHRHDHGRQGGQARPDPGRRRRPPGAGAGFQRDSSASSSSWESWMSTTWNR